MLELLAYEYAHGTAGACDHAHCGLNVGAVEVGHLLLCDLAKIFLADGCNLVSLGDTGSGLNTASLLYQQCCRGGLGDKGEATVGVNGDNDRDHHTHIVLSAIVKVLGELADIYAVLTKCGTYRGSRSCLAGGNLESDVSNYFLCQNEAPLS